MIDNIKRHKWSIEHISTKLMIADPMTKSLPVKESIKLCEVYETH
jgi:hypothetical protein